MSNHFLGIDGLGQLRRGVAQNVHVALTAVFQAGNETKRLVRKRSAFGNVAFDGVPVEILGMIAHAQKGTAFGKKDLPEFPQRELAIRIRAVSVERTFEHGYLRGESSLDQTSENVEPVPKLRQRIAPLEQVVVRARHRLENLKQ